jgi:hypothetical protein
MKNGNTIAMQRLMDAVEAAVFEDDGDGEFPDCAFALLALADPAPAAERKADDTILNAEVAGYRAYLGKDSK